jgi:ribosomal protein L32
MTIPCRCGNRINGVVCFTRRSLAKRPEHYTDRRYMPRCPNCGARMWFVDKWRLAHEIWGKGKTCNCGGYWFPHRLGSKYCYENPKAEQYHSERYVTGR